jgi:hypothetical protein
MDNKPIVLKFNSEEELLNFALQKYKDKNNKQLEYCNQLMNLIYKNLLFQKSLGEKRLFDDFHNKTKNGDDSETLV